MKAILAQKKGMTQIFDEKGQMVPVTILLATPNKVTQIKKLEKDGYEAVQLGFGSKKNHSKPVAGHLKKTKSDSRVLIEYRTEKTNLQAGDNIDLNIFTEGETVKVEGISKGKGFAGVIKRHNFHRGPMSHGSRHHREPGSIGAGYPQHVFKGQKLPGRMGAEKVTVKNLTIAKLLPEENLILIKGAVPGPQKGTILISALDNKKSETGDVRENK